MTRSVRVFFYSLVILVAAVSFGFNGRYLSGNDGMPIPESIDMGIRPLVASLDTASFHLAGRSVNSSMLSIQSAHSSPPSGKLSMSNVRSLFKFFLFAPPEYTTTLLLNNTERASRYYQENLNEESAEIWLHRGFERMVMEQSQDPSRADVVLIAGYFHLNAAILKAKKIGNRKAPLDLSLLFHTYEMELEMIHTKNPTMKTKPHLILIPSWNPTVAANVGIKELCRRLENKGYSNLWSVGFERNTFWQGLPVQRILPIPYVVRPDVFLFQNDSSRRVANFVFYVGDRRPNAQNWAGCHRDKLILTLQNASSGLFDVRLVTKHNRIEQSDYNHRMATSDYCLILCGDTPSSRTLTSAIVSGCIPLRVGSRLRGLCEPPCHGGFGWKSTGGNYTHLPFSETIPWSLFPEVDEQEFMDAGQEVLSELFKKVDNIQKQKLRSIMQEVKSGWIYGWDDPVNSTTYGDATIYIWQSFLAALSQQQIQ